MTTQTVRLQIGDTSTVVDAYMTESERPATTCYDLVDILNIDIAQGSGNVTHDEDRDVYVCTVEHAEWLLDTCRKISDLHTRIDYIIGYVADMDDCQGLTESEAVDVISDALDQVDFNDVEMSIDCCNAVLDSLIRFGR